MDLKQDARKFRMIARDYCRLNLSQGEALEFVVFLMPHQSGLDQVEAVKQCLAKALTGRSWPLVTASAAERIGFAQQFRSSAAALGFGVC